MLIRRAEIALRDGVDVRIEAGRISEIGASLDPAPEEQVIEADGGALLPGLHDHHIHLFALAASRASVRCGPPTVRREEQLRGVLQHAARTSVRGDGWLRGSGYHESIAGALDRRVLDELLPEIPLRVQHRSGAMWMLNGAALARLGLADRLPADTPPGAERDPDGYSTGRFLRVDGWLRELWPSEPPDLARVGRELSRFGVTGVTDATPGNRAAELEAFIAATTSGDLRQRVVVMGAADLPPSACANVTRGARKVMLAETDLPGFDALQRWIEEAHADDRAVAIHCVTRTELALATAALAAAGQTVGDRIEHAAVAPPDLAQTIADLGLTVVTQPNFVYERGDVYLEDVEPRDRPWLYRCQGLLDERIPLGAGTDAPFGDPDPWLAMRAAVDRTTASGAELGARERLTPERALALFTSRASAPGGPSRTIGVGRRADLCLLDRPWRQARESLSSQAVAHTIVGGETTWRRDAM